MSVCVYSCGDGVQPKKHNSSSLAFNVIALTKQKSLQWCVAVEMDNTVVTVGKNN